jgi:hypothetical protein
MGCLHQTWLSANTGDRQDCPAALAQAGCVQVQRIVGAIKPRDTPKFKWINTTLGGASHALKCRKQAQTHVAAFA